MNNYSDIIDDLYGIDSDYIVYNIIPNIGTDNIFNIKANFAASWISLKRINGKTANYFSTNGFNWNYHLFDLLEDGSIKNVEYESWNKYINENKIDISFFKAFVSITFESIDVLSKNDMSVINNKLLMNDKIKFSIINKLSNSTYIIGLSL